MSIHYVYILTGSPLVSFISRIFPHQVVPSMHFLTFYFSSIIHHSMWIFVCVCLHDDHSHLQCMAFIWAFSPPNANIISSLIAYFQRYPHKLHIMKIKTHIFLTSSWCPFLYANMMNLNFSRTYFKIIGVIYYMIWARFFLLFVVWYVLRTNNFYISKLYYLALLFIKIKISNPNIHTIYFK